MFQGGIEADDSQLGCIIRGARTSSPHVYCEKKQPPHQGRVLLAVQSAQQSIQIAWLIMLLCVMRYVGCVAISSC